MKNASSILSHISYQPQFKSIRKHICYRKFIKLLQPKFQKAIAFVYVKNSTLFVALSHPGYKMELNYNRDLLISLLKQLTSLDEACKIMQADKVAVFHSKYRSIVKEDASTSTIPYYNELSSSHFSIKSLDLELQKKFKQIQQTIKDNFE